MKISVIIPCYNERNTLEKVVAAVRSAPVPSLEIIIIDDASTDGTAELLRHKLSGKVERIIYHEKNKGKGAALRTGPFGTSQSAEGERGGRECAARCLDV